MTLTKPTGPSMLVFFGVLVITFTNLNRHEKPPVQREDPWDTLGELVGDITTLGTITNEEMIFPTSRLVGYVFSFPGG